MPNKPRIQDNDTTTLFGGVTSKEEVSISVVLYFQFLLNISSSFLKNFKNLQPNMVQIGPTIEEKCRKVIQSKLQSNIKSWVLFENQTFVILDDPVSSIQEASTKATEMMVLYGPVMAGGPAGDFNVHEDEEGKGWIVSGHCPRMFTYVDSTQAKQEHGIMVIGLIGRSMRDKDGKNPKIVHVELAGN